MTPTITPSARPKTTASIRSALSRFARSARLSAAVLLAASAVPASAQNYSWTQRDSQRGWTCVASSGNGTKMIAGIDTSQFPHVFVSSDGGVTWPEVSAAGDQDWSGVASSSNGMKLLACGTFDRLSFGPGKVLRSSDGGVSWTPQTALGTRSWYGVASSADGQKLLAAAGDSLWVSIDGGVNWTQREAVAGRDWHAAAVSANGNLFVAGDHATAGGYLYTSTDGLTWQQQTGSGLHYWSRIAISADGVKITAVDSQINGFDSTSLYRSTNSGAAWSPLSTAGSRGWKGIACDATGDILVAVDKVGGDGNGGQIWVSTNGGTSWTAQASAGVRPWTDVASSSDGTKLVACTSGTYLYTGVLSPNTSQPNRPPSFDLPMVLSGLWSWDHKAGQPSPKQLGTDTDWQSAACGKWHTVAIKRDGCLYAQGKNDRGQLGDGTTVARTEFVQVGMDIDWQSAACGEYHTMAVTRDGRLYAWGRNEYGQLGIGNNSSTYIPAQVGTDMDWQAVACGTSHTVAVKRDGRLYAWGRNSGGQLGIGNTNPTNSPVRVGTDTDWESMACGSSRTLAVKRDGRLYVWGGGEILGLEAIFEANLPIQIGTDMDWRSVAYGEDNSKAVKRDGRLFGWGLDHYGQLGFGSEGSRVPVQVRSDTDWQSVACGDSHTVGIKQDGRLYAWGRLGNSRASEKYSPTQVGTDTGWQSVACGPTRTMARRVDGIITWGNNLGTMSTTGFATNINAGGEAGQTVSFTVTTSNNALFSQPPAIASNGTLTFTPATGAAGEATVTVKAVDTGGTANGGRDTSDPQLFKIKIIAGALKASDYVGNSNPINLVNKTLINNTGATATLPGPVTMGGTSGVASMPGQGVTFTGARTFSGSDVTLDTESSVNFAGLALPLSSFTLKFTGTQPDLTLANPGVRLNLDFSIDETIVDDGNCVTGIFKMPGIGTLEATCLRLEFSPLQAKATWKGKSIKLKAGNSPGTAPMLSGSWGGGVDNEWEISNANGTEGQSDGWDLWDCTGSMALVPVTGKKHGIILRSLTAGLVSGPMQNFNPNAPYTWKIISAAGGITGFSPDLFALDTTGIRNDFGGGSFGVALQNSNRDLVVTYTPALRTANWTNDATSGIGAGTLWARRFGSTTAATINGVAIPSINTTTVSSPEFDLTGPSATFNNDANTLTTLGGTGSAELAKHFIYGGNPATLTLKQLTPGYTYTVSLFSVGWDTTPGIRSQTFASGTDTRALDQNTYGENAGCRVDYTFTADAATRTLTITPPSAGFSFHLYGMALRLETLLPPVVTSQAVTSVTATGATLNGTVVSSDARSPFVARGFVIAATASNSAPELFGFGVTDFPVAGTTGAFSEAIPNLLPGTQYSVAVYAENEAGIAYSTVVTFTTTAPVPLPSGAISWYKAENNALDSVGTNHATAFTTSYGAGKVGQAFSLTGASGSYLNCTNDGSLKLATGTVEAWIKVGGAGSGYRGIMVKPNAWGLFLENNNLIGYDWGGGGGLVSTKNLADNNWHHVALTFTAGSMNLYADGVLVQSRTSFAVGNQNSDLVLGAGDANGTIQNFNGQIDEATIYSRVLSPAEVLSIYNAGAAGKVVAVTPVAPANFNFTRNGANYGFSFTSAPGLSYTLWQSDTLAPGTWTNTGQAAIPGDGTAKSFTLPVPNSTVPKRFYRVQAE